MPSNKQAREAAQRRLQRQLERREQLARKRHRNLLAALSVIAVLAVVGAIFAITSVAGGDDDDAAAAPSTSAAPSSQAPETSAAAAPSTNADGTVACTFTADDSGTSAGTPAPNVPGSGTAALTMATSAGDIGLSLDQAGAPCAAASFVHLATTGFFNGTPCHRETASEGLKVLQCGDPTGTGTGGPGYSFPTQVTGGETYGRGTLAMANAGAGTDGSQFFLVYADSQLPPDYTVFGTIDEAGLGVLDAIAAKGIEGGAADGAPAEPVTIITMTVQQ
ncbi:peptidylprolyl isomerase [Modestobacter sp. VKM Ac-2986]|uniref:peptidylprolyl isomerase n=1 Tax=Modestobacter sp. VKM Ac-2986 TaxID=3004140 RepID=UPI0022AA6764|nr:peptidylprolyl isomerase [Modestobacter sp. VKM Ac-2986]MCZ2828191.1 peptidylprolyl isomerase [Modestobacter sp. VKM Ac-2986]